MFPIIPFGSARLWNLIDVPFNDHYRILADFVLVCTLLYSSVDETKTVIQGTTFSADCSGICFEHLWVQNHVIPLLNSVAVCLVDVVDHVVGYHT